MNSLTVSLLVGVIALFYFVHNIYCELESIHKSLKSKLELRPNERLKVTKVNFKSGLSLTKEDGEPLDSICLVEFSNVKEQHETNKLDSRKG